ncbi:tetratricopeptide repeat protein [Sulfitobacter sp. D35]|uniref:tetratricopeptide repeat protein n=1 Tax=Sulfitobacter sp. D35 TaxID=3083252 RepID=UPI00296F050A|nr:tetratricopeptide repeat protein [Sulfitobacter sp. D35]MDW4499491.1 tetratricopeptide repeat protein [Sulfitobacter sp. D35]
MKHPIAPAALRGALLATTIGLAACTDTGGLSATVDGVYAPGIDPRGDSVAAIEVGHRLVSAGEYELAIDAFNRAALDRGDLDAEILSGLGAANLGLGRLGQAETQLRRATKEDAERPEVWNNLGVVLMEKGETAEAEQIFRKAYALDNGQTDAIRDNLRRAIEITENPDTEDTVDDNYELVRRGSSDYVIRSEP